MKSPRSHAWAKVLILATLVLAATQCTPSRPQSRQGGGAVQSDLAVAAQKTYVAPGDHDQYYMFSSGGHSGQVYVYGVPSMRHRIGSWRPACLWS